MSGIPAFFHLQRIQMRSCNVPIRLEAAVKQQPFMKSSEGIDRQKKMC